MIKHSEGYLKTTKGQFSTDIVTVNNNANVCMMTRGISQKNKANAERIIRCWNMHDELLDCCKDTLRILNLEPTHANLYQINKLTHAINKAEL